MKNSFINKSKFDDIDHLSQEDPISGQPARKNDAIKIVQCPNCQTTFAVQSATLEGLTHPRFHCSRCDNVFSLETSSTADELEHDNLNIQSNTDTQAIPDQNTYWSDTNYAENENSTADISETSSNYQQLEELYSTPSSVANYSDISSYANADSTGNTDQPFDYEILNQESNDAPTHGWTIGNTLSRSVAAIAQQRSAQIDFPEPTSSSNLSALFNTGATQSTGQALHLKNFSNWGENELANTNTSSSASQISTHAQLDTLLNPGIRRKKVADFDYHSLSFNKDQTEDNAPELTEDHSENIASQTTNTTFADQSWLSNNQSIPATALHSEHDSELEDDQDTMQYTGELRLKNPAYQSKVPTTKRTLTKNSKLKPPTSNLTQLKLWDNTGKSWTETTPYELSLKQSLALTCLPIIGFVILLSICSYIITDYPKTAQSLASMIYSKLPQSPASTVNIINTKHKIITLENGEKIHLITGDVKNNGSNEYKKIIIQTVLYGASGNVITERRVPLANSLARAKVSSLSWEMIEKLQDTPQSHKFRLLPEQTSSFAVAINSKDAASIKHFGTRIYSVLGE